MVVDTYVGAFGWVIITLCTLLFVACLVSFIHTRGRRITLDTGLLVFSSILLVGFVIAMVLGAFDTHRINGMVVERAGDFVAVEGLEKPLLAPYDFAPVGETVEFSCFERSDHYSC